jgi:hypothetical protein
MAGDLRAVHIRLQSYLLGLALTSYIVMMTWRSAGSGGVVTVDGGWTRCR